MAASANKNIKNGTLVTNRLYINVGIFIIVLLLIPFSIWLFRTPPSIQPNSLPFTSAANSISYQGNSYTFFYPKGWTLSKSEMENVKGTTFFLQPPDAQPPKTPHVTIEVAEANPASISDMTDEFTIFKYTKTNTVVNGINAQKYTNIVPSSEGVLHSTAYVFEAKGNIYLVSLGYKQELTDPQLENEFSQIVNALVPQ